jgi:glycerophosphoryl diester phosphodiesterase
LGEVLDLAEKHRKTEDFLVNIEIKGCGIAGYVAKAIEKRPLNFIISSFDMQSLYEIRDHNPYIKIGALLESGNKPWDVTIGKLEKLLKEIKDLHPATINLTLPSLTALATDMIRKSGASPVAWTSGEINPESLSPAKQKALARQLADNKIDMIITDYPLQMREVLNHHV